MPRFGAHRYDERAAQLMRFLSGELQVAQRLPGALFRPY